MVQVAAMSGSWLFHEDGPFQNLVGEPGRKKFFAAILESKGRAKKVKFIKDSVLGFEEKLQLSTAEFQHLSFLLRIISMLQKALLSAQNIF